MEVNKLTQGLRSILQTANSRAIRRRRFRAVGNPVCVANVDVLEDRLLLTADFGDAPDTTTGTATNNYQTLAVNGGPSHMIDATENTLYLGGGVDGEAGDQQSLAAHLDNLFTTGGRNDEDGVMSSLDLTATISASPKITLSATNTTGTAATLYGWVDYNHNGVFENATERAQIAVPTGTTAGRFTLQFPKIVGDVAGGTYARFRLSSDAAAANPIGSATGGEVEDYKFQIMNQLKTPIEATSSLRVSAGVNGGPDLEGGDAYGYIGMESIGDLDGNGVADLIAGAIGYWGDRDYSVTPGGSIYVLFRNADGSVSNSVRISNEVNGGPSLGQTEHFGISGTSLGDIDGDGVVDIAVGSSDEHENGAIYILHMKSDGTVKDYQKIIRPDADPGVFTTEDDFSTVEAIGDIDGDGITDITVGASGLDISNGSGGFAINRGAVYILRLNADGTVKASSRIDGNGAWNPLSADNDHLGGDLVALGDIDGDGVIDLAVGSEIDRSAASVVNILQLNSDGSVKHATRLLSGTGGAPSLENIYALMSMTAIDDIDGDGINDLAVSGQDLGGLDPLTGLPVSNRNVVNLLRLNADGSVKGSVVLPGPDSGDTTDLNNLTSIAYLGDGNGDGQREIAVGIPFYATLNPITSYVTISSSVTVLSLPSKTPNTSAPAVPVLNAIVSTPSQIPTVSWPADTHADSYEIWLRNQTTGQVVLNSVSTTSNSFTPPAGVGNFVVWVRAVNEIGKSSWSRSSTFASKSPVTVIATPDGMSRRPELKWNSLPGAATYEIWLSDTRTPSVATIQTTTRNSATSFTPPTNLQAASYRLWVRAVAADGMKGQWSTVDEFSVVPSPVITTVAQQFTYRPKIEFTPVPGAVNYELWINNLTTPAKPPIKVTTAATSSFIPAENWSSGNYRIWIRGVDGAGKKSEWSAAKDFSSGVKPSFSDVTRDVNLFSQITLSWPAIVDAERYQIWSAPPIGMMQNVGQIAYDGTATTFTVGGFGSQGTHRFWLRAIGHDGQQGAWSSMLPVTVRGKMDPVNVSMESSEFNDYPTFWWFEFSGVSSYEVRIDDNVNNVIGKIQVANIKDRSFVADVPLTVGTYSIQIRGISPDGTVGLWSDPLSPAADQIPQLTPAHGSLESTTLLQWSPVAGAWSYLVFLRNVDTGKEMDLVGTSETHFTVPIVSEGKYRWRIQADGPNFVNLSSLPSEFVVVRRPQLIVPAIFNTPEKILSWSTIEGADHYEIWISNRQNIMKFNEKNVSGTSFDLGASLPTGAYRLWVRAISSSSVAGPWSAEVGFSVV